MSAREIINELPKLTPVERRQIAREIFDLETDAEILASCDAQAEKNFLMLDKMEAEDAARKQG